MRRYHLTCLAALLTLPFFGTDTLYAWSNGQNASYVLGQPNFTSNAAGPAAMMPESMAYDAANHRLFVADTFQSRVLVFDIGNPVNIVNGMSPLFVLGQPTLNDIVPHSNNSTSGFPTTSSGMGGDIRGLAYDPSPAYAPQGRLFVADGANHRVLVYDFHAHSTLPGTPGGIQNGMQADYVLGQSTFTDYLPGAGNNRFNGPTGLAYDSVHKRLFVGDRFNNRLLMFDLSGSSLPAPGDPPLAATRVLGQRNLTDNTLQPAGQSGMAPEFLSYDSSPGAGSERLFVADEATGHVRILVFRVGSGAGGLQAPPPGGFAAPLAALNELGQASLSAVAVNTGGPNNMGQGSGAVYDHGTRQVFAADEENNRVLVFDATPLTDGMAATDVLGQVDFTSYGGGLSASSINHPEDVLYTATTTPPLLFVADTGNNRILVFRGPPPVCTSPELICGTISSAEDTSIRVAGVPVELRNRQGKLLATKKSDGSGFYSFEPSEVPDSALVADKSYYVTPITGRTQSAVPLYTPIISLPSTGVEADFQIHGVPGKFRLTDLPPTSFILISTFSYTGAGSSRPPSVGPGCSALSSFFSATIGPNKNATLQVPSGTSYYLTCWLANSSGLSTQYQRIPAINSAGPFAISPNQEVPLLCQ